jgi:hypothetical protein
MKHRILLVALSILLAIPLLGLGAPAAVPATPASRIHTLTLVSGGGTGGFGTPDPITTYAIVGGSSGQAGIISANVAYGTIPGTRWVNTTGVAISGTTNDQASYMTTNYVVSFALPKCYASASITVQVLADNAATLFLNGTQFGQQTQADLPANYQVASTFTLSVTSDFLPGANTLTIANADFRYANGVDFQAVVTHSGFKFNGFFPPIHNPGSGPDFVFGHC